MTSLSSAALPGWGGQHISTLHPVHNNTWVSIVSTSCGVTSSNDFFFFFLLPHLVWHVLPPGPDRHTDKNSFLFLCRKSCKKKKFFFEDLNLEIRSPIMSPEACDRSDHVTCDPICGPSLWSQQGPHHPPSSSSQWYYTCICLWIYKLTLLRIFYSGSFNFRCGVSIYLFFLNIYIFI